MKIQYNPDSEGGHEYLPALDGVTYEAGMGLRLLDGGAEITGGSDTPDYVCAGNVTGGAGNTVPALHISAETRLIAELADNGGALRPGDRLGFTADGKRLSALTDGAAVLLYFLGTKQDAGEEAAFRIVPAGGGTGRDGKDGRDGIDGAPGGRLSRFDRTAGVLVSFVSDDGHVKDINILKPIFDAEGVPGNVAIPTSYPGLANNMTWAQIKTLHDAGWSICSHAHLHTDLNTMTEAQIANEMSESKRILTEQGYPASAIMYPLGNASETVRNYARKYYTVGIISGTWAGTGTDYTVQYNQWPNLNNFGIARASGLSSGRTDLAMCKGYIDAAIASGKASWIIFVDHSNDAWFAGSTSGTANTELYRQLVNYAKTVARVVNIEDGIALNKINLVDAGAPYNSGPYTRLYPNGQLDFTPVYETFSPSIVSESTSAVVIDQSGANTATGEIWRFGKLCRVRMRFTGQAVSQGGGVMRILGFPHDLEPSQTLQIPRNSIIKPTSGIPFVCSDKNYVGQYFNVHKQDHTTPAFDWVFANQLSAAAGADLIVEGWVQLRNITRR